MSTPRPGSAATSPRADATGGPNGQAGPAGEPEEVEVKLSVARPEVVLRMLEAGEPPLPAGFEPDGEIRSATIVDTYVDSGRLDGRLFRAGIRARVRVEGPTATLTVKRRGRLAGNVTTRAELEGPATTALDPEAWPDSAAKALLVEALDGEPPWPIATLRQHRTILDVRRGGTRVELSLDELESVRGTTVVDRRVELEAELKSGDADALEELAEGLLELDGVGQPLGSKLDFALGIDRSDSGSRSTGR